jgi:hypothetical protein
MGLLVTMLVDTYVLFKVGAEGIPTMKVPHILTLACDQQNVTKRFKREIVKLT